MAQAKLKCFYCGREREEFKCFIGAAPGPDWCVMEGTGKTTCPDCYETAKAHAQRAIDGLKAEPCR